MQGTSPNSSPQRLSGPISGHGGRQPEHQLWKAHQQDRGWGPGSAFNQRPELNEQRHVGPRVPQTVINVCSPISSRHRPWRSAFLIVCLILVFGFEATNGFTTPQTQSRPSSTPTRCAPPRRWRRCVLRTTQGLQQFRITPGHHTPDARASGLLQSLVIARRLDAFNAIRELEQITSVRQSSLVLPERAPDVAEQLHRFR
jgi:hypothetical protein